MQNKSAITQKIGPWVTFFIDEEVFAVSAEDVQEVMMEQPLTPVPLAPEHIMGLLNLRGQVMPAIDLRKRLQCQERAPGRTSVFIVVKAQGSLVSVVVDNVGDVLELTPEHWHTPPDTLPSRHKTLIFGICPRDGRAVMGLEVDAMSGEDEPVTKELH